MERNKTFANLDIHNNPRYLLFNCNHIIPNGMLFLVAASGMDFSGSIVETSFLIFIGQEIGATGILGRISFVFPFRDSGA